MSAEIYDLIARLSWETNTEDIQQLNTQLKAQDKTLEELRVRGKRLEDQLAKTSDPAKQAKYSQELAKTRVSMQQITEVQKKQVDATKQLNERQKELLSTIDKVTDPKQYKAMLNELAGIERAMKGLNNQTRDLPTKLGSLTTSLQGVGGSILSGLGLGVGSLGLESIVSGIKSFVESANQEFIDAENTTLRFQNTLKSLGKERYFDTMIAEADALAKQVGYLDNDDIVSAQEKLLTYGKVGREEISRLLPIIIELSARLGTDVPSATETMINILEGRGGQALRQVGLSVKEANTTTERLGVVFEELGPKIAGSVDVVKQSSEGMKRTLDQQVADLEESIGKSTIKLRAFFLQAYAGFLTMAADILKSSDEKIQDYGDKAQSDYLERKRKMSDEELEIERKSVTTKFDLIYNTQAKIAKLQQENEDANDWPGKAWRERMARIEGYQKLIKVVYADINSTVTEIQARQNKEQEDAAVRAKRDAEDAAEANKELAKRQKEEREAYTKQQKAIADAKQKQIDDLRKQVEADRLRLSEFTLTEDEKELAALKRKYDEQMKLAEGHAKLMLQIEDNYQNAKIQVQRKRDLELTKDWKKLQTVQITDLKETNKETAQEQSNRWLAEQRLRMQDMSDDAKRAEEKKQRKQEELLMMRDSVVALADATSQAIELRKKEVEHLISLQNERIKNAENNSQISLKIEEDRLNELIAKRNRYERAQRVIDATVVAANQAVAISAAIRSIAQEGAKLGPVGIAAQVIAIGAGLFAAIAAVRNATNDIGGFREGGYTGDGDPSEESTAVGRRPYKYHKREFVMNEELTSKHRSLFQGLHDGQLQVHKMDDGKYYITRNGIDTDRMIDDHVTIKNEQNLMPLLLEMQEMKSILRQGRTTVNNNFDAEGFGMAVATQMGEIEIKNKRR